jgi:hypothetical protein
LGDALSRKLQKKIAGRENPARYLPCPILAMDLTAAAISAPIPARYLPCPNLAMDLTATAILAPIPAPYA